PHRPAMAAPARGRGRPTSLRTRILTRMSKTLLVTGGTSGFGAATARRFVAAGWRVVATGRRADRLQALVDELGSEHVHAACFDVRDADAMRAALDALPDGFRAIDLLVNNAGLALGTKPA